MNTRMTFRFNPADLCRLTTIHDHLSGQSRFIDRTAAIRYALSIAEKYILAINETE